MLALNLLLVRCDDMTDQDKANAYSRAASSIREAQDAVPTHEAAANAPPLTLALLERGQQRYRIYCTPCHSELGDGNGMVVQRGFPHPPSYHSDRLRQATTQHFYDVITHGYGAMYSFAGRVAPDDRWAIAAYIRALQLSQQASAADIASVRP
jgi:mono/diheme cytochrome c family protein